MDFIYMGILGFLLVLATFDLFVGVANDAVNFLSPAVGARAAKFRTILIVAAVGIFVGAATSSGMMDIARHGILNPAMYSFEQVMCIFLAVAATDVVLLDIFNMLGMPTSTTVSMVFGLLGGSTALAMVKLVEGGHTYAELINTDKALSVILGIFLSVAIAFVFGYIVMWISRVIFTFNYKRHLRWTIALFGGLSITSIIYFLLVSGIGKARFMTPVVTEWIGNNEMFILLACFVVFTVLMELLHLFRVNIFKIIVLFGTFALAMAFAGNDLVNFIGVPLAGLESYEDYVASGSGNPSTYMMSALLLPSTTSPWFLIAAGLIMTIAIFRSKKAHKVIETSVNLARQDEGDEVFSSSRIARRTVRNVLAATSVVDRCIPRRVKNWVNSRFNMEEAVLPEGVAFDLVRASVNLVLGGLLIVVGTSLQLPLSTTYVAFMVAMGSSLADRAWGRESAVYRISGVMTVVAGWFITALGGFLIAFVVGLALIYGGTVAFVIVTLLCGYMLIHSNFLKKGKSASPTAANADTRTNEDIIANLREEVCHTMECATKIYDRTLIAVFKENRKVLRDMVKESNDLFYQSRERKYTLLPTLKKLQSGDVNTAHYYVQVVDYLNEMTKALMHITRPAFEHIDNNHEGLSKEQAKDLMSINDDVESIYRHINQMLRDGDFTEIEMVLALRDQLFESIAEAIKSELGRINEARSNTKASMLYLTILTETKNMVLQSRNLLKSQQYFLKHRAGAPQRWIKPTK